MRIGKNLLLLAAALVVISTPALAFHDGGVADCQGCHTMHNSQNGALVDPDSPGGNPWLLVDATPSDVCLACHATRLGAVFSADPLAPGTEYGGGDFTFLTEDNLNDGHGGATDPINGDAAGHNLDAPSMGVGPDGTLTTSPGGAFPAAVMGCTSCHDPHGTDSFRLLYGSGRIIQDFYAFTADAPDAAGLPIFGGGETNSAHTAYIDGMSAWCGNCHGDFHNNSVDLIHKSGTPMGGTIALTYDLYNGTSDQIGGAHATAYLAAVPFEDAAATTASTVGPVAASQISCITCHRAHATSAMDAGRWDFQIPFLHEDGLESGSYQIPDPYADLNQRSLCNKCHNQDAHDEMPF